MWPSLLVALAALAVYATLCPPVSGMGDGSEFTLVLATNGVAHPTGYPLYTFFGHFFVVALHGLGVSFPLAANLWSAVGAATAICFLHAFAMELVAMEPERSLAIRALAALVPAALFAFQPVLMPEATSGEVNSWSLAWVCLAGYVFVKLIPPAASTGKVPSFGIRQAILWGLLCGAGLAHHATSVLVSLPFTAALLAIMVQRRRLTLTLVLAGLASAAIPLASYGIIAWRAGHPALVQWPSIEPTPASVMDHITGKQYRHFLGYFAPDPEERPLILRIVMPFLGVGAVALFAGLVRAREATGRMLWGALLAAALLVTGFTLRYGVPDPSNYFLPAMALGSAAIAPVLVALVRPRIRGATIRLGLIALASVALVGPWISSGAARRREVIGYETFIRSMWQAVPSDTAIVFWPDDRYLRLREYQILKGERPALWVLAPDMLLDDRTRLALRQRFGVDPLEGNTVPQLQPGDPDEGLIIGRYYNGLVESFNRRIQTPVIMFDPSVPVVRQMWKPWERHPAAPSGGSR